MDNSLDRSSCVNFCYLEMVSDGFIVIDGMQRIRFANAAARNLFMPAEDYRDRLLWDMLPEELIPVFREELDPSRKLMANRYFESAYGEQHSMWLEVSMFPNQEGTVIQFRDLTEAARQMAESASKAKSKFLSMMSHELRTPLNSILGFAQVMLDDHVNSLKPVQQDRALRILKSGRHLIHLINDILGLLTIESGSLTVTLEETDLAAIIEESVRLIQPMSEEKRINVQMDVPAGRLFVKGDSTRIRQVMINLLSNAVKYNTPNGSIAIRCELIPRQAKVTVEDSGIGIPDESLNQIFEPFYRIYDPEFKIDGTGIGLTLVKNFIDMMGGTVGVKSKYRKGSEFWFTLPLP